MACSRRATISPTPKPSPTATTNYLYQSADLALGSLPFEAIVATDRARFSAETFNLRSFDASQALLFPTGKSATIAFTPAAITDATRWSMLYAWGQPMGSLGDYAFFQRSEQNADPFAGFMGVKIGRTFTPTAQQQIRLHGLNSELTAGVLTISTFWEQLAEPTPLTLHLKIVAATGQIIAQWQGLGVEWMDWQQGDKLVQRSNFSLPDQFSGQVDLHITVTPNTDQQESLIIPLVIP